MQTHFPLRAAWYVVRISSVHRHGVRDSSQSNPWSWKARHVSVLCGSRGARWRARWRVRSRGVVPVPGTGTTTGSGGGARSMALSLLWTAIAANAVPRVGTCLGRGETTRCGRGKATRGDRHTHVSRSNGGRTGLTSIRGRTAAVRETRGACGTLCRGRRPMNGGGSEIGNPMIVTHGMTSALHRRMT